jgi:ABC-type multidrug transport system permease subunit
MQFLTTLHRAYQRIIGNWIYYMVMTVTMIVIPIIIGSMFYDIPEDASGFFSRGGCIFFSLLFNTIINFAETSSQFAQIPIVEKHNSYAMYHPFVDSLATVVVQYPLKFFNVAMFSTLVYFIAHLKREAGPLFIFMIFTYVISLTMTGLFRTIATLASSVETALACTGLTILPLAIYSGYVIPRPSMHPWFKWISYIVSRCVDRLLGSSLTHFRTPSTMPMRLKWLPSSMAEKPPARCSSPPVLDMRPRRLQTKYALW